MLSWYSLLAFSAWTWLFLPCTASTISHIWRNFKRPSFFFLASLLLHLAQVLFPFLATKPSHLSCTLAHSCCHFPAFPDFPWCLSPLLSDSNCNLFLCNSELQDLSVSFSLIVTVYWYWLIFIAFSTRNQISTVGYIWSEGCTVRRLAPQPIAFTQKTTQKTMKFLRALSAPVTLPSRWWTLHLSGAPNCAVLSRLRKLTYFHVQFLSLLISSCLLTWPPSADQHFTHTLLPCKRAAASLLVAPSKCHRTTNNIHWNTLKCEVLGLWHPKFKEPQAHVHLWHHW